MPPLPGSAREVDLSSPREMGCIMLLLRKDQATAACCPPARHTPRPAVYHRASLLVTSVLACGLAARAPAAEASLPELVFVELPAASHAPGPGPYPAADRYLDGSRIVRYSPGDEPRLEVLTREFVSAADPAVSFDGREILFAGKRQPGDSWQIWRMDRDGGNKRQISHGAGDKVSPLWVGSLFHLDDAAPTGQIVYVSTQHGWRDERTAGASHALFASDRDGANARRITFNLSSDFDPDVLPNGRLVFSSWRVSSRTDASSSLMGINIDGTDLWPYYGSHEAPAFKHMARVGSDGRVYFIETSSPGWLGGGDLAFVSQRRPLSTHAVLARARRGHYLSPCPLPDGGLLASWRRNGEGASYAIYRIDPHTGKRGTALTATPGHHAFDTQVLAPHPGVKGRSSVVSHKQDTGVFYALSAFMSDRPEHPGDTLRSLRVIEGVPAADPLQPNRLRILGVVPLEADGSFHIEVPAETPVRFQLLDERGTTVLSQRSWTWVMPRESRGCIGCHADRELAPPNVLAKAVVKPARKLKRAQGGE